MISIKIQKLFMLSLGLFLLSLAFISSQPRPALAIPPGCYRVNDNVATKVSCDDNLQGNVDNLGNCYNVLNERTVEAFDCNNSALRVESTQEPHYIQADCQDEPPLNSGNCGIITYLVLAINILSAIVGIVVVISIIIGGIQYSTAGSDPQKTSAAKNRIRNSIIALLFYIFGYALLNYLIPGGVL